MELSLFGTCGPCAFQSALQRRMGEVIENVKCFITKLGVKAHIHKILMTCNSWVTNTAICLPIEEGNIASIFLGVTGHELSGLEEVGLRFPSSQLDPLIQVA